jgi:hypothetical protein
MMGTIAIKKDVMGFTVAAMSSKECRTCTHMVYLPDRQGQRCTKGGFYVGNINGCNEWTAKITAPKEAA